MWSVKTMRRRWIYGLVRLYEFMNSVRLIAGSHTSNIRISHSSLSPTDVFFCDCVWWRWEDCLLIEWFENVWINLDWMRYRYFHGIYYNQLFRNSRLQLVWNVHLIFGTDLLRINSPVAYDYEDNIIWDKVSVRPGVRLEKQASLWHCRPQIQLKVLHLAYLCNDIPLTFCGVSLAACNKIT